MIGSAFDTLQKQVFNQCKTLFGLPATWLPSAGGAMLSGVVLFNDPTKNAPLGMANFSPGDFQMEYHFDTFAGLKSAVDEGLQETVIVGGQSFWVRAVNTDFDGNTYKAILIEAQ